MNTTPLRAAVLAVMALLLTLTAACGPGVGGSGTGADTPPPASVTSPAYVCGGDLAPALACDPATGTNNDALLRGTAPVGFGAVVDGQAVLARVEGNRISFSAGCTSLRFAGSWGSVAAQEPPRFVGFIDPSGTPAPATLAAQRDGSALWLTLRAADGTLLYGPVRVAPAAGAVPCV